jgi:DNA polymerase-3 subunit epsilon
MKKIAVIDLETTGFLPNGLIVEVGITELDLETGKTHLIYNELVKEEGFGEIHRNSWIFKNTDLKFEDVMKAKPFDKETIQSILDNYKVSAFNKKFDFAFLKNKGLKINELPCIMYSASKTVDAKNKNGKRKAPNVQEAWDHFFPNSDYKELHRGGDDSVHEAMIAYELYKLGEFEVV